MTEPKALGDLIRNNADAMGRDGSIATQVREETQRVLVHE
jgi:hypothetical protein